MNVLLWIIQILLGALFLFAGGMKLILPLDKMTGPIPVPGLFLRFIGVCETLGGLGLILPGLFRIRTGLTPLAAAGLVIIMAGATVLNLRTGDLMTTTLTIVVGLLAAFVAYARWKVAPLGFILLYVTWRIDSRSPLSRYGGRQCAGHTRRDRRPSHEAAPRPCRRPH